MKVNKAESDQRYLEWITNIHKAVKNGAEYSCSLVRSYQPDNVGKVKASVITENFNPKEEAPSMEVVARLKEAILQRIKESKGRGRKRKVEEKTLLLPNLEKTALEMYRLFSNVQYHCLGVLSSYTCGVKKEQADKLNELGEWVIAPFSECRIEVKVILN